MDVLDLPILTEHVTDILVCGFLVNIAHEDNPTLDSYELGK